MNNKIMLAIALTISILLWNAASSSEQHVQIYPQIQQKTVDQGQYLDPPLLSKARLLKVFSRKNS